MTRKHTITVWNEPHEVEVYQSSKTVWIAVGDYMGKRIEVKDRSAGSALKRWREAAHYMGPILRPFAADRLGSIGIRIAGNLSVLPSAA